jgi:hypothetical protein
MWASLYSSSYHRRYEKLTGQKAKKLVKLGQIWKLGDHLLLCGSSLDPTLVKKLVGTRKIQAVIVDPPYGVAYAESKDGFSKVKVNKRILNDNISTEPEYVTFTKAWLTPILPHLAVASTSSIP